ncbi:endonuclease/exonuclease/phosphatase family protein [Luteolibacter flavescens]|uniref:Endonuclease/exonuclease/phosphatase family protein n=1 Tax=Luteolibacter flavescens TaxID=1859460 RepID=A0ABT3FQT9_9BACT|nr:endonuclease/exonuclease/phosphatase family protein [Luteolibacter flavescens]MCW1885961.1 endonuclease/exonuclease/phosphatase family protein [Luteolibacter flavescens]
MRFHAHFFSKTAPGILGAFLLSLAGCEKKDQTGDWAALAQPPGADVPAKPVSAPKPAPTAENSGTTASTIPAVEAGTIRFVVFNVENWLTMERYVAGKAQPGRPKPEKERLAVASVLAGAQPDILGVSEIGTEEDVRDLQTHLEKAGHPMPHFHLNRGADPVRNLVLLSRFPIARSVAHDGLTYRSKGKEYGMQRGILDASIETPSGAYRFLGVHLKSKRETQDGDQEGMRLGEAHLLRMKLDGILHEDPAARLVVYGDFNDTRNSPAVRTVRGSGNGRATLQMISLKDSQGESWTHFWDYQDTYTRIDYVMVSDALRKSVKWDDCRIIDGPEVSRASDHRPLLVILK